MIYFSKNPLSFYDSTLFSPEQIPAGAVVITQYQHNTLKAALGLGHVITLDGETPVVGAIPEPPLSQVQAAQLAALNVACAEAITSGFSSSALGTAHTYASGQNDQANLTASVVSSLLPNLPGNWTTLQLCMDSGGNWAYLPHTAAQIQQAGVDLKTAILALLVKKAVLSARVTAATTAGDVQAVAW
jgi:hypothetical protein